MVLALAERLVGLGYALWDERAQSFVFVSEQYAGSYGLTPEEFVDRFHSWEDEIATIHPEDRERYQAYYRSYIDDPRECSIEVRYFVPGEGLRHYREFLAPILDDSGELAQTVVVELEITELKTTEAALRQAQKMEAVGQLTGGIAHDFNNLLAVIVGNLELVSERGAEMGPVADFLRAATGAAERGADLTQRLLTLSRRQATHAETVDLRELADGMLDLLRRTLGTRIEIDVSSPPDLWCCRVDRGQFENSLLNLALNGRDAMSGGGTLVIEFSNVEIEEKYNLVEAVMESGQYVCLSVTDTGAGMMPEVLERASEPFFTTKSVGAGSGLGLSMVYGFAKQSNGYLNIKSEVQRGTTVGIFIPRDSTGNLADASDRTARETARSHGESLLLVDDDDAVLEMMSLILESLGYAVTSVKSACAALDVVDASPRIDLLVTDVMLGGGYSGPELAREAGRRRSNLPVLFVSGYPQQKLEDSGFASSDVSFLAKPFRKTDLAQAVRTALDGK
jgi:signal transduction histidine kinase/ActR/RegA family two-component response regulator